MRSGVPARDRAPAQLVRNARVTRAGAGRAGAL